ncbi:MAG: beta-ketoacyl-ACP synthase II [Alkalispirochaetaceae bacterium]
MQIAITGIGVVSSVGLGAKPFWEALREGRSGASMISTFDTTGFKSRVGAEVRGFDSAAFVGRKRTRRMARFSQFASAAALQAVEDSGLDLKNLDPLRVGTVVGTAAGDYVYLEEQHQNLLKKGPGHGNPLAVPLIIPNMSSANVGIDLGIEGPNFGVTTACATGGHAIGLAALLIRSGMVDVAIAGGSEAAISPLTVNAYADMGVLTSRNDDPLRASRPFDRDRDGFLIGEGAGILILERVEHARGRGAEIYAYLAGSGMTTDAHSVAIPEPEGRSAAAAIKMALRDGGVPAEQIDYVNAHGTSTVVNDRTETKAIRLAFGAQADKLAVSSTKSMIGHTLGAAGAIEAAATVLAVKHQILPPTINYETPDPECDLDYVPKEARDATIRAAISNSFGFGGQNSVLLFTTA